jgi:hypothetical protein
MTDGTLRYWDGTAWTVTHDPQASPTGPTTSAEPVAAETDKPASLPDRPVPRHTRPGTTTTAEPQPSGTSHAGLTYGRAYARSWPWIALVAIAGFAMIGGAVAQGEPRYSIVSGAIDGALQVLLWSSVATLGIAWLVRRNPQVLEPGFRWRLKLGITCLAFLGLGIAGTVARFIDIPDAKPPTQAQFTAAAQYLSQTGRCTQSRPVQDVTGLVSCQISDGHFLIAAPDVPRRIDPKEYDTNLTGTVIELAQRGISAKHTLIEHWQPDFDLTVFDATLTN